MAKSSQNGASPEGDKTAFGRFEALTKQLIDTPKEKVDAQLRKAKRRRTRAAR
jgi:hypothetical protein